MTLPRPSSGGWGCCRAVGINTLALALAWALALTGCTWNRPSRPVHVRPAPFAASPGQEATPAPYLRTRQDAVSGVHRLEVAVRDFTPLAAGQPRLQLAAVVHLGASNYYASLQGLLAGHPLVLFEGIGATNRQFPSRRPAAEGEYSLQPALARALGLAFQLEAIDYQRDNFVNSDLTLAELAGVLRPARDGPPAAADSAGIQLDTLLDLMNGTGWLGGLARFGVRMIGSHERLRTTVRLLLIETLGQLEGELEDSPQLPADLRALLRALIEERNRRVVRDVTEAVARRPAPSSIAVFYGAGHMPDLEQRLRALGYRPAGEQWLTAFEADPRAAGLSPAEVDWMRRLVDLRPSGPGPK